MASSLEEKDADAADPPEPFPCAATGVAPPDVSLRPLFNPLVGGGAGATEAEPLDAGANE